MYIIRGYYYSCHSITIRSWKPSCVSCCQNRTHKDLLCPQSNSWFNWGYGRYLPGFRSSGNTTKNMETRRFRGRHWLGALNGTIGPKKNWCHSIIESKKEYYLICGNKWWKTQEILESNYLVTKLAYGVIASRTFGWFVVFKMKNLQSLSSLLDTEKKSTINKFWVLLQSRFQIRYWQTIIKTLR